MKIKLPPPLSQEPPERSFWEDFKLLSAAQMRITWNKIRHWPPVTWIVLIAFGIGLLSCLGGLVFSFWRPENNAARNSPGF